MSASLASTTLMTGADDKVAAIDIYSQQASLAPTEDKVSLSTGLNLFNSAPISLASATENQSLSLTNAISDIGGSLSSAFQSLETGLKDLLTNSKIGVGLKMDKNGIRPTFNIASMANINGIKTIVNVIGNQKGITAKMGVAGQVNFLGSLLKVSAKMNISDAFTKIAASVTSKTVLNQVTKGVMSTVVSTSNVSFLASIADAKSSGKISLNLGGLVSKFSANFKIPIGTKKGDYLQLGATLSSSFGKLDPKWNISLGGKVGGMLNGNVMLKSSGDFKAVMRANAKADRRGFGMGTSASVAISSIPNKPPARNVVRYDQSNRSAKRYVDKYPSGKSISYYEQDGSLLSQTATPMFFDDAVENYDNSGYSDPFTMGSVLSDADTSLTKKMGFSMAESSPADELLKNYPIYDYGSLSDQQGGFGF